MFTRRRIRILLRMLIVCCCAPLVGSCAADRLILSWNQETIDPKGMTRKVVQSDGHAVECWLARSPSAATAEPRAILLYFVGKGDRADRWTGAVAGSWEYPVEAWGMNYPGSGGSEGPVKLDRVVPYALAVYDAATQERPGMPVYIQAGSFGTTAALAIAARRPVAGLILHNPPPLKQLILQHHGWWNLWLLAGPASARVPDDLDSITNAGKCTAPAVFLLSGNDTVVPHAYHLLVSNAYAGPKRIIDMPAAGHADALPREAAEDLAKGRQWMWDGAFSGK